MKTKLILVISLLTLGLTPMKAQNKVTGTVTDKNGYPIAGAKVENPKTQQSVLTDPDGTFSMTTDEMPKKLKVRYVGMGDKTVKYAPNMNIKLKEKAEWHFNVSAGIGQSKFVFGSYGDDFKYQFAWKVAVGAEKEVLTNIYFMPSLMFSNTNSKYVNDNFDPVYMKRYHHYNIQLALLGGYDISFNDDVSIRPKIGPYVGYVCGNGGYSYFYYYYDYDSNFLNRFAVGGIVGIDFNYKKFVLGVDYQLSFNHTIREEKLYTGAGYITIGYKF